MGHVLLEIALVKGILTAQRSSLSVLAEIFRPSTSHRKKLGDDRHSHSLDDQYEELRAKVMDLIFNRALLSAPRCNKTHWFYALIQPILTFFRLTNIRDRKVVREIASEALCAVCPRKKPRDLGTSLINIGLSLLAI